MTLFGHKKNKDDGSNNNERSTLHKDQPGAGNDQNAGLQQGSGATNLDQNYAGGQRGATGAGGAGVAGIGSHNVGPNNYNGSDPYNNQATVGNNNLPPAEQISTQQQGGSGGHGSGKIEHAVGALVGSQALKARGDQKEREAGAFKAQSAEIAEAERLEKEAILRRERAVAHGAHPDNRHLGGINGMQGGNANTGGGY